ncbi:hypothetical protein D3C76_1258730 [compost metagenome]
MFGVAAQADPTAFAVGVPGLAEAVRGSDFACGKAHALLVTVAAERGNQLAGDFGCFLEDGIGGIGVDALGQGRQAGPQGRGVEHIMQDEAHVAQGGCVGGHRGLLED